MKTLAIILNHNLPEYTNRLYNSLQPYQGDIYDLMVMDNGSLQHYLPARVDIRFDENLFFGGALNEAFRMVLMDDRYDSLLFLNNDLEMTPEIFVSTLRNELFRNDFAIVAPCIAGGAQPWRQMQNWGARSIREVKWIDLQAPLFHRRVIEKIKQFDNELFYGWGQELICYDVCTEMGWKTGVCDFISILHFGKQTLLQNRLFEPIIKNDEMLMEPVTMQDSHAFALETYRKYFSEHPLKNGNFEELRKYGETYTFRALPAKDPLLNAADELIVRTDVPLRGFFRRWLKNLPW